ncbi:hypothetical protein V5799_033190 [Amblyomma americanum]|uniref:Peptidase S54 rhomboid domain-containing protein n=1 Tax=Amblyomma americanum TaxID=6943 RepID=A0AAQ4DP11_AMBAM
MAWPKAAVLSLRRRLGDFWGVGLLLARMFFEVGPRSIPPVTAAATMLQVAIYCRLVPVTWRSPWEVCMSVSTVLWRRQWRRIVLGQLEHADSMHLYFNMISFVWKGIILEKEMGSRRFGRVLILFFFEVGAVDLLITSFVGSLLQDDYFYYVCSIGFSGVVFALKVLKNVQWYQERPFPGWVVWLELLLIHIAVPGSSLLGHLAGVLVGFGYVYGFPTSSSLFTPTFVATLVSGLIVALRATALPASWAAVIHAPCLSSDLVFNRGHWELLLLSPLHATSDLHAAYVACSLMFLGWRYEKELGSIKFALWALTLTLATGLVYCFIACTLLPWSLLGSYLDGVHAYEMPYKCFTGLTAVLLALKVRTDECRFFNSV